MVAEEIFVGAAMMPLDGSLVDCQICWNAVKPDGKMAQQVKSICKPFRHIFLLVHDELSNLKLFYQQDLPLKLI